MRKLRVFVFALLRMLANAGWLLFLMPIATLGMLVTWNTDTSLWVARHWWSPVLIWIGRARLEVSGREHVDPRRPTVYVSNHQSTLDIPVLLVALPVNFRFVAKSQLKWIPVLGWYLWLAKHIFIDRANRTRAIASLREAGKRIRGGTSIVVFPEGTRSSDKVLPFKKGPFALAIEAGAAICPVTIEGSGKIMPKNSWDVHGGVIHVRIGAPIDASAYTTDQRDALMKRVRDSIITQNLELGGAGGDKDDVVAAVGQEGVSARSLDA